MSLGKKPLLRALKGQSGPPPLWLMRQAGRYLPEYREVRATCRDFLDLCYSPDKAVEVTLQPLRRYGFDAAILFADILLVPDALGCEVAFKEGEGPRLRPVRDKAAVAGLKQGDVLGHLAPVMETVTRLSKAIPERTTLIGFAGAPWTVATYMVEGRGSKDFVETKKMAYGDRAAFSQLIERLVEVTAAYLVAQVKAGAEVLQLFDTWAGVLPEAEFKDWVVGPTQRIVEKVAACCPGVPTIGFPKGAGAMLSGYAEKTGVTGVGLDTSVPLDWAVKAMGGKVTLQGNLDPVLLVAGGDALDRGVDRILHQTAGVPFIFNLGHGILPETRPENVARLVERVRRWRG